MEYRLPLCTSVTLCNSHPRELVHVRDETVGEVQDVGALHGRARDVDVRGRVERPGALMRRWRAKMPTLGRALPGRLHAARGTAWEDGRGSAAVTPVVVCRNHRTAANRAYNSAVCQWHIRKNCAKQLRRKGSVSTRST